MTPSSARILIVDDEEIVRESLSGWLEKDGYSRRYIKCVQPRMEAFLTVTGVAPTILSGSENKDVGTAAVSGLLAGVDKQCRRYR